MKLDCTGLGRIGLDCAELCWIGLTIFAGLGWIGLDWAGLGWTCWAEAILDLLLTEHFVDALSECLLLVLQRGVLLHLNLLQPGISACEGSV